MIASGRSASITRVTASASAISSIARLKPRTSARDANRPVTVAPSCPPAPVTRIRIDLSYRGADDLDDQSLLLFGQLAIDRQRQRLGRRRFGVREIAGAISERGKTLLQMKRDRVVDFGPHARLVEP